MRSRLEIIHPVGSLRVGNVARACALVTRVDVLTVAFRFHYLSRSLSLSLSLSFSLYLSHFVVRHGEVLVPLYLSAYPPTATLMRIDRSS